MKATSPIPIPIQDRIRRCGVVAVLVIDDASNAVPLAQTLLRAGIDCMELTLRTDAALNALKQIRVQVPEMLAGIGTVLTTSQVDEVAKSGAAFAVAPGLNAAVVARAQQRGLPFAPGVMTPTDVEAAIELGCRELKFFPAEPTGGAKFLRSMTAPYAHLGLNYLPLGGINEDNVADYLAMDSVLAVGGSWVAPRQLICEQDWAEISRRAKSARIRIDSLR